MSEGNAWEEGGKETMDRRGRVSRGRSISEGQTMNGEKVGARIYMKEEGGRRPTPESSTEPVKGCNSSSPSNGYCE